MHKFTIQQLQQMRDWQVCLHLPGEIMYPTFMLYARELKNAKPANNKLNVFELLALFRASQGESQRHTDEVTLRKLTTEEIINRQDF